MKRHLEALEEKHRIINEKVDTANTSLMDSLELRKLKSERLQAKQEMAWFRTEIELAEKP